MCHAAQKKCECCTYYTYSDHIKLTSLDVHAYSACRRLSWQHRTLEEALGIEANAGAASVAATGCVSSARAPAYIVVEVVRVWRNNIAGKFFAHYRVGGRVIASGLNKGDDKCLGDQE